MDVLPADRLRSIASRLIAAQPDPPRRVDIVQVLHAYEVLGLLLVPDFVILGVLFAYGGQSIRPWVLTIGTFMTLLGLVVVGLSVSSARTALETGRIAVGEVLSAQRRSWPSFGQQGLLRVNARAEPFEAMFAWAGSVNIEPGQRIKVLIAEKPGRVLITLGPTS